MSHLEVDMSHVACRMREKLQETWREMGGTDEEQTMMIIKAVDHISLKLK